jgi:hypothetical protein
MLVAGRADARYLDNDCLARFRQHVQTTLGSDEACSPEAIAAVFLAQAIRVVRRKVQKSVTGEALDIAFNTCVPIDQRENNKVLEAFQKVVATAEWLDRTMPAGESAGRAWVDAATEAQTTVIYDESHPETRMFVVPEAVASIASYLVSLKKRSGLHALVDIGSGTTDLSILNLSIDRRLGSRSFWYASRSIPMGTAHIEDALGQSLAPRKKSGEVRLPHTLRSTVPSRSESMVIARELETIWMRTRKGWAIAYGRLKKEAEWRGDKVQVFLAGGGSLLPQARARFSECPFMERWGPYPCGILPEPDSYSKGSDSAPFSRLSVAYGLSVPVPELGEYILPADCPDHTPPRAAPSEKYAPSGDDELLPKYGWT